LQGQQITGYEYWFDRNSDQRVKVASVNGNISLDLDIAALSAGLHFFTFRAQDSRGQWSAPVTQYFLRLPASETQTAQLVKYEYWFDRDTESKKTATFSSGIINLDLDVAALSAGLHFFTFRAQDSREQWSAPVTQYFLRLPAVRATDYKIAAYEYWFNESDNEKIRVNITPVNPLELKDLLIEVDRLQKSAFNDPDMSRFLIRFLDTNGKWSAPLVHVFPDGRPGMLTLADLTISDKVYDGTLAAEIADTGTLAGLLAGDDVGVDATNATAMYYDANVGYDKPVVVTGIVLTGADADKYVLQEVLGVMGNIIRAPVRILTPPEAMPIVEGQKLRRSELIGGEASVSGQFRFESPDDMPLAGTLSQTVWFIPNNVNYESVLLDVLVTVLPKPYNIFASTEKNIYATGETVVITGMVTATDLQSVDGLEVEVHVDMFGFRRTIQATTNASGEFSATFVPQNSEAAHYTVICSVRNEPSDEINHRFDIVGMRLATSGYIAWEIEQNKSQSGVISIQNRTGKDLTNIAIELLSGTPNAQIVFSPTEYLAGNSYVDIPYTVSGLSPSETSNWEEITLKATSAEGAEINFKAWFYCHAPKAALEAIPGNISMNMTVGKSKTVDIRLCNNGGGPTGTLTVMLPNAPWMSLTGARTLPSIAPGDTALFTLKLNPDAQLPTVPYDGNIAVHSENGNSVSIPFKIRAITKHAGQLNIDVKDEYTYNTEAKPHLANAVVSLSDPYSGETITEGVTGEDGLFVTTQLPEGQYILSVSASKHSRYRGYVTIEAGENKYLEVFLSFNAITYEWLVTPTEIEDQYEIELVTKYETNVPKPVLVVEMPKVLPELVDGESSSFLVRITNKGLIAARDVTFEMEEDHEYKFNYTVGQFDLYPEQTTVIPVVVGYKLNLSRNSNVMVRSSAPVNLPDTICTNRTFTRYRFECENINGRWEYVRHEIKYPRRVCVPRNPDESVPERGGLNPPQRDDDGTIKVSTGYLGAPYIPSILHLTGCIPCSAEFGLAGVGCLPGGSGVACVAQITRNNRLTWRIGIGCAVGVITDALGNLPGVAGAVSRAAGCLYGIGDAAVSCFQNLIKRGRANMGTTVKEPPSHIIQAYDDLHEIIFGFSAIENWIKEILGDDNIASDPKFQIFLDDIADSLNNQTVIPVDDNLYVSGMNRDYVDYFVNRWNSSMEAWVQGIFVPNEVHPDIINREVLEAAIVDIEAMNVYAEERGFSSTQEMYETVIHTFLNEFGIDPENPDVPQTSNVCASVSLQIDQKLVMTREAFRGTLNIFNGHESDAMQEVNLQLTVKDTEGNDCSHLFQIVSPENAESLKELTGVDGTGVLESGATGTVTILFIPTRNAAPEHAKSYRFGGKLSYHDPFSGETTTVNLLPVELEVQPSPELHIHYFLQRDVYGDDPLTEEIEPMIPADLAVLIDNRGYGEAKRVMIESAQPRIIDNEKGLLIDFRLIGSSFNNQPQQLGMTDINFGNVAPRSQALGQWWLTCTLMGHFISFETRVSHLNSYGNPDLSLISEVRMHELIRTIRDYNGITGFFVNDIPDAADAPDAIWFADGRHSTVRPAVNAYIVGNLSVANKSITLTVEVGASGWSYAKMDDPGNGKYRLASVTREDGQVIPLNNVWQTHVTMPDRREPIYENKLHFVDTFAMASLVNYTLTYEDAPQTNLHVVAINGIPADPATQPLEIIEVIFNKQVKEGSFNWMDLDLYLPGSDNLITSGTTVTMKDGLTWEIDLSAVTQRSGVYTLTIHTESILDTDDQPGQRPAQATWIQLLTQNATLLQQTICEGDIYNFHGQMLNQTGDYFHIEYDGVTENVIQLNLTVNPFPTVSLGDDRTVQGLSVELDAGEGFASYLWSTGNTGQKITVSGADGDTATVSVTVTNTHNCQATTEVTFTFEACVFIVSFDTQGGSALVPLQVKEGGKIDRPGADPVRSGFSFGGWYKESSCDNVWNFVTDIVSGDLTLYAKWNSLTGISEMERLEALIYPNPVQPGKTFYIRLDSKTTGTTMVEIFNEIGQLLSKTVENVDPIRLTATDATGSYFIRITIGNQTQTYKLVVE